jgi:hypothetical protein
MALVYVSARNSPITASLTTTDAAVKVVRRPKLAAIASRFQTNFVNAQHRTYYRSANPLKVDISGSFSVAQSRKIVNIKPQVFTNSFVTNIVGPIFVTASEVRLEGSLKLRNTANYNDVSSLPDFANTELFKGDFYPVIAQVSGLDLAGIQPKLAVYNRLDKSLLFDKELGSGASISAITTDPNTDVESVEIQFNILPIDTNSLNVSTGPINLAYVFSIENNGKVYTIETGAISVKSPI